ncbi:uncharacterized protein LOC126718585 isoform X3 [Quercus robur]|nr:uncharacterized protein LOC126718585 isoform X3 [Quercus robur]
MSLLGWRCGGTLLLKLKLKLKLNTIAAASSATASASTTSSLINLIRHNSKRCLSFASNHEEEKSSHSQCPHQHSSSRKARILVRGRNRGDKGMDFYSAEVLDERGSVNIGPATLVATVPFDYLYGNDVEYCKLVNGFLCFQNMEAVNILNLSAPPQSLALCSPVSNFQFSGLGFDPLSNQFKFFSWPRGNRESPSIFTFGNCNGNDNGNGGSNSWRQLAPEEFYGADLLCNKFFRNQVGVSANGALYWLTYWVTNRDRLPPKIVAFDLHEEIFRLVPYPDGAKSDLRNHVGHLAAVCGRLAFIEKLQPDKLNIWILQEDYHNCNYSWVKQTIRFPFDWSKLKRWSRILAINTNTDEIFLELDVNHCSLVCYNTKTENMKRLEITGLPHWSEPVHCKLVGITFDDERG